MRKAIKNYLAKLQDNKKKGFSLVELIIVIAIMAILVGVVASQVIPYIEKSRQAKDVETLNNLSSDLVVAITDASTKGDVAGFTITLTGTNGTVTAASSNLPDAVNNAYKAIHGSYITDAIGAMSFKSDEVGKGTVTVTYTNTDNKLVITSAGGVVNIESSLK